jgi:hypothetical protein
MPEIVYVYFSGEVTEREAEEEFQLDRHQRVNLRKRESYLRRREERRRRREENNESDSDEEQHLPDGHENVTHAREAQNSRSERESYETERRRH